MEASQKMKAGLMCNAQQIAMIAEENLRDLESGDLKGSSTTDETGKEKGQRS